MPSHCSWVIVKVISDGFQAEAHVNQVLVSRQLICFSFVDCPTPILQSRPWTSGALQSEVSRILKKTRLYQRGEDATCVPLHSAQRRAKKKAVSPWVDGRVAASAYLTLL